MPRFYAVFLVLFSIISTATAASDDGDDFSNNLLSDMAPLLVLFGEQVAKQFLSQSIGWADNIIFAMAPLGIITAVVAAIRVGGPTWLRAIIGRAKESQGAAELELMSSTSSNVCELWNGQAIVRVLGSPEIIELVYLEKESSPGNHPESSEVYSFEESKLCPSGHGPLYGQKKEHRRRGIGHTRDDEYELLGRSGQPNSFYGDDMDPEDPVSNSSAPNISLNARGELSSQTELWLVAIFGTIVQVAVILYDGLITLYDPWRGDFQKGGRNPAGYAFPITAVGSIGVVLGMMICSHVVEASTVEEKWNAKEGDRRIKFAWLQKGQVVNDQDFDSYALFCLNDKQNIMTSRVRKDLRGFSTLVLIGTSISLIGFVAQFMGLRGMHWSATIAQLGATGIMSAMRAIIRRHLTRVPRAKKLIKNFELDCMAREIAGCERFCLPSGKVERSYHIDNYYENLNISGERLGRELIDIRGRLKTISGWSCHYHQEISALCDAIEQTMEVICDPSNELTTLQRHLELTEYKWNLMVETRTKREGIPSLENLVLKMTRRKPMEFGEQWGKWRINRSEIEAAYSLCMLDFHEHERRLLSAAIRDQRPREDPDTQKKTLRFLGFGGKDTSCAYARCLYDWWIARDTECFEVTDPTSSALENDIATYRILGGMDRKSDWGVAVASGTPLEKLCAQHIYSIFMSTASDLIASIPGEMAVRRNTKRKVGSFGISHTGVEKIAQILRDVGLATLEEAYMSIIPPLAEKLPSILDVQQDTLKLAKSANLGRPRNDMLFWFNFTCHVTARTIIGNRKDLTDYTLAADAYFKTVMACLSIFGETDDNTLIAIENLLRACKILVFKAWKSQSELPDDLEDARNWYRKVFDWIQGHVQSPIPRDMLQIGLLKINALYEHRFGDFLQAEASQSLLDESDLASRWDDEQRNLEETWTKLEGNGMEGCDRMSWSSAISLAMSNGFDAVVEILLEAIPDVVALAAQMEYGTETIGWLANNNGNHEQAIINEFTMRCASRTFYVDSEDEIGTTALCRAVISGERHLVETLLDAHGANINKEDGKRRSPIYMAATLGHNHIFHFLLQRGANWLGHHEYGNTCLHVAASNGFEDILEALVDPAGQQSFVDITNDFGETPLHFAARSGNLFSIHHLHRAGASIDKATQIGHTPLAYAAIYGNHLAVQALKEKGANINFVNSFGESILKIATKYSHFHIVTKLLNLGALPEWGCVKEALRLGDDDIVEVLFQGLWLEERVGYSVVDLPKRKLLKFLKSKEISTIVEPTKNSLLRLAIRRGASIDRISLLLALNADPLSMDKNHNSVLSLGVSTSEYDLLSLLMPPQIQQAYADTEIWFQEIVLRAAVECRNIEAVLLLLKTSPGSVGSSQLNHLLSLSTRLGDISITEALYNHGLSLDSEATQCLLRTAVSEGLVHILKLLDTMGVSIKDYAEYDFSLHTAARLGKESIVSALLVFGVNVDSHAQNGWTALQVAVQAANLNIVKLLVSAGAQIHQRNLYEWSAFSLARAQKLTDIVEFLDSIQPDPTSDTEQRTVSSPSLADEDPWVKIFELDTGPIVVENQEAELIFQLAPAIDEFPDRAFELPNVLPEEETLD